MKDEHDKVQSFRDDLRQDYVEVETQAEVN